VSEAYLFLGPTLPASEATAELDAVCLPPASAGDVYRLWRSRPRVIGIVDGGAGVPAVWHKEIMWVMERGVHVFGSAAMGALRAAELASFGMRGTGWVYEAFRDGILDRDDEVAVKQAAAEDGYQPRSEAMVNVRRTLDAAGRQRVISPATLGVLARSGAAMFYQDRTWPDLIRAAGAAGADAVELDALSQWLPAGQVAQQADDARAMLAQIRGFLATDPAPLRVSWRTENTAMFAAARHLADNDTSPADATPALTARVLDEVRLRGPGSFEAAWGRGLLRVFAAAFAEQAGMTVEEEQLKEAVAGLRNSLALDQDGEFARFLTANGLAAADLERLVADEELVRWACGQGEREAASALVDELRMRGQYAGLAARARAKAGYRAADPDDGRDHEAIGWYFRQRRGTPVPGDLAAYARACGFAGEREFRQAVRDEHQYSLQAQSPRRHGALPAGPGPARAGKASPVRAPPHPRAPSRVRAALAGQQHRAHLGH
jgi:hypothetical protein